MAEEKAEGALLKAGNILFLHLGTAFMEPLFYLIMAPKCKIAGILERLLAKAFLTFVPSVVLMIFIQQLNS
jgi:hypothetical protein